MIAQDLFDEALKRAGSEPELSAALKRLKNPSRKRADLVKAARKQEDTIERAASAALRRLRSVNRELASMLETVAVSRAASGDEPSDRFVKLRREHADLVIRIESLEEAESTTRLELEQLEAKAASTETPDAPAAPPSRAPLKRRLRPHADVERAGKALADAAKALDDARKRQEAVAEDLQAAQGAVLQRLLSGTDADPVLAAEKARADAAREDAVLALVEQGILPLWRSILNELLDSDKELPTGERRRYRTSLEGASPNGLSALPDREREVPTDANRRLGRVLDQLPGGSIGISGPRGVGKTTLIRSVCEVDAPPRSTERLSVMVYAPVKYASLDFVLHLFESACRASLPPDSRVDPLEEGADARLRRAERSIRVATRIAIGLGLVVAVVGILLTIKAVRAPHAPEAARQLLAAAGLVAVALVVAVTARASSRKYAVGLGAAAAAGTATAAVLSTIVDDWSLQSWAIVLAAAALGWPLLVVVPARVAELSVPRLWHAAAGVLVVGAVALGVAAATGHELGSPSALGASLVLGAVVIAPVTARIVRAAFVFDLSAQTHRATLPRVLLIASNVDRLAKAVVATGTVVAIVGLALVGLGWLDTPPTAALGGALALALGGGAMVALLSEGSPIVGITLPGGMTATLSPTAAPGTVEQAAVSGWASKLDAERLERLEALANASLQRIKYQRAFNAGWSTKVGFSGSTFKLPFSAEASSTGGRTSTEQAMTLPEVVALLRDFLQTASTTAGGMVIGIDEIDKMGSEEDAERFLNDVKAIFGIPKCYFLISVSEDAVASFERRGMPFRDVFDSALDDVLRVDHLSVAGTEALLTARTIDMSQPFKALCHAVAGGLPRDVIRVARRLFDLRDTTSNQDLGPLTRALTAAELTAKRDGTVTAAARLGGKADATDVLRWLGDARPEPETAVLQAALVTLPPLATSVNDDAAQVQRALDRLVRELAAYWYLCATLTEFFTDERQPVQFARADTDDGQASIEQLARARQAFTIDPGLAWQRVTAFREAWGLLPLHLDKVAQAAPALGAQEPNGAAVQATPSESEPG